MVKGDLVFDEIGECVVDGAVASDDDEAIICPDAVAWPLVLEIEYLGGVALLFEEGFALIGELGGLISA